MISQEIIHLICVWVNYFSEYVYSEPKSKGSILDPAVDLTLFTVSCFLNDVIHLSLPQPPLGPLSRTLLLFFTLDIPLHSVVTLPTPYPLSQHSFSAETPEGSHTNQSDS